MTTTDARPLTAVPCAFCKATGTDPFHLLSERSRCEVCKGRKRVTVALPYGRCAFCHGTGQHKTFSCMVCRGKGVLAEMEGETAPCPECGGRAVDGNSGLPCLTCRGRGKVRA